MGNQFVRSQHRLIPPYHLQTNGMVERFNGRIQEILKNTKFDMAGKTAKAI
ncbi:hypothetical protein CCP3SC15_440001 [Gammaproteobacteria bacterium]